ncbi:MAG: Glu-tRNA(Gln) amidotransferase subunit GatD [Candidatus Micrarchaeia archaeon]
MYSDNVIMMLSKKGISIGDVVEIEHNGRTYRGILLESPSTQPTDTLLLKLPNGYNVGIKASESIRLCERHGKDGQKAVAKAAGRGDAPAVALMFGGTISSKVEYKTGAVFPSTTPEEFASAFPEAAGKCSFRGVTSILSEDVRQEHWRIMGEEIYGALKDGKGVVATHGTDTLGYSAAAVSFMISNPVRPVVFTGAQRSSDRGSSDNKENFLNSLEYALNGRPGVFVCMHSTTNDGRCDVHLGTRVRKMHTSRRDAFKSINARPVASVGGGRIVYNWDYAPREGKMELNSKFSDNVALVWVHPGIKPKFISGLSEYDGVVLAGTGMGHVPTNPFGDSNAVPIIKEIEGLVRSGVVVVIAPQTLYGRINLNVYTAGRMLQEAGVIGHLCDWLPETAFVKLCWALGQSKDAKKVREIMLTNYAGELSQASGPDLFYEEIF